jgi:hypothetical protein
MEVTMRATPMTPTSTPVTMLQDRERQGGG